MFVASAYAAPEEEGASGELNTETGIAVEGTEEGGFPPFDSATFPSQLLWLAITFGLFYLFIKRVAIPRIGGILEVRRDRIAQDLDQAARMKDDADAAVAAYEQELADARKKAGTIGQEARDNAKAEADAERRKVEAELDGKLAEAEERIAAIKASAMADVGSIAEETAGLIVQELIGGRVDKAAVAGAVKSAQR
ncbi:F0F1 ATP synthase subunit B [Aquibium sp. A9E412]|uniref:F0F1 ATP synthase subunit B n=1 Tax=Aquibium sp. A9E412 TaxID=2976767 RepID=UPI0025B1C541|nr:F0F1 ATP synthase subunit B [Aquibium sp. A9E412]MDN2566739.1 F0F1 ATP synthase subunit B [Aquibium sp. A9E412]